MAGLLTRMTDSSKTEASKTGASEASASDTRATDAADRAMAAQYDAYPYPARDPRDEATRLVVGSPGHLREIDHWVFGARRPRSHPLRALFAGGGTGDGAIMLATGLRDAGRPGAIVHLDRSTSASGIAARRAEIRRLGNIAFRIGSLLDAPEAGDAPFDYIDCCGVLHHLPDPGAGLAALVRRLAPGGGIGIMVYAPHGRTGVYQIQDALRLLVPADAAPHARLDAARRVMRHLPQTAWLRLNRNFADHLTGGDAGLYDLLLSPRDRPFTVAALADLVAGAGLRIAALIEPARYDPDLLLPDGRLRERTASLPPLERAALAEHLAGDIATHVAYLVRADDPPVVRPDPRDPDAIPIARETAADVLASRITPAGIYPARFGTLPLPLALPARAGAVLRLVDGTRTVGEIAAEAAGRGIDAAAFERIWPALFRALESANRLLFRAP